MAGVARLMAMVGLDSRAYTTGANQVMRQNQGLRQSFQSVGRAIGVSLSVAGIIAMGRAIISWASDLSIAARNSGLLTSEMIALNRIGLQNNVQTAQMAQLVQRMQIQLTQAAREGGKAAETFEKMGLNIADLIRMRPADQVQAIATAATRTGIPLENLADLFGQRLGPQARAALEQIANEGLPAVTKALGDAADRAEYFGSQFARDMDRAKGGLLGFGNAAAEVARDFGAFFGGVSGGRDAVAEFEKMMGRAATEGEASALIDEPALSRFLHRLMAGSDAIHDRRKQVEDEITARIQAREDEQKRNAEELARIHINSMDRQLATEQEKGRQQIESAERSFRALAPALSQMERMGASFGGTPNVEVASRDREVMLLREQNRILEEVRDRTADVETALQAARKDL